MRNPSVPILALATLLGLGCAQLPELSSDFTSRAQRARRSNSKRAAPGACSTASRPLPWLA